MEDQKPGTGFGNSQGFSVLPLLAGQFQNTVETLHFWLNFENNLVQAGEEQGTLPTAQGRILHACKACIACQVI